MAVKNIYWNGSNQVYRNSGDTPPFHAEDSELEACCCADCPADCDSCPATGTLTISGLAGQCPVGQNCTGLNQSYSLTQIGAQCDWTGLVIPWFSVGVRCALDGGQPYWIIDAGIMGTNCATWRQAVTGACPPETGWVWVSGVCSSGTVSIAWD